MFPRYSHISERMSKIFCLTFKPLFSSPYLHHYLHYMYTYPHTFFLITFTYPSSFSLDTGSKWLRVQALETDLLMSSTQVTLLEKNPSAIYETRVWSLAREDPLEERMATHASILAWRIPRTEEPGGLWSIGSHRVRHNRGDLACLHLTSWSSSVFTCKIR